VIRAIVVDDETLAREELTHLLLDTGEIDVVAQAANAVDALSAIRRHHPEALFLDVQMPVIDGFQLLGMLDDDELPEIVFVTAYHEFALRAFEENAIDYLLKPVSANRLAQTIERLKRRGPSATRSALASAPITRVPCPGQRTIKLLNVSDIEFARSELSGVYVVTAQGEYATDLTLRVLELRAGMLRCHKQYLVNPNLVDEILLEEGSTATLRTRSGKSVPVSRRHFAEVRQRMGLK
jgi:two-component system LytT family response regulator